MRPRSKPKSTLAALLDDYTATARAALASHGTSHLGRWTVYAAATGAALASATSADASMITGNANTSVSLSQSHIGPNANASTLGFVPLRTSLGSTIGRLAAALHIQRVLASYGHLTFGAILFGTGNSTGRVFTTGSKSSLRRFAQSEPILAGNSRFYSYGPLIYRVQGSTRSGGAIHTGGGQFASGVPGYAGFQLGNGDIGWIQLTWTSQAGNGIPDQLTIGNWAINTDGEGILAGTTIPATPEPGTLTLTLLAMGAAGIAAWRKRRAENRPSAA